jgi:hypothetical protein
VRSPGAASEAVASEARQTAAGARENPPYLRRPVLVP